MCLNCYFQRRHELMAPDERMTLSRRDIEFLLERYGVCSKATEEAARVAEAARKNTAALAKHYRRSESTVRGWITEGRFGSPEMLKPNGRDYEVPRTAIEKVDRMLDEGKRFMDGEWRLPTSSAEEDAAESEVLQQTRHTRPLSPGRAPTAEPPKRPRTRPSSTVRRYGGWRPNAEKRSS